MSGGNKSLGKPKQAYIAIPMSWIKHHGLKAGDIIKVTWSNDDKQVIVSL